MEIVINDANLFFDLINAELIDVFFELPFDVYTTDFVISEITDQDQLVIINTFIENQKLKLYESDFATYSKIVELNKQVTGLSIPDCSVWYYSKINNHTLLSGDKLLRNTAMRDNVTVKGLLYVFDKLVDLDFVTPAIAANKLGNLIKNGTHLPPNECKRRIERWAIGKK